ncbi:MAG: hypothetical protein DWI21_02435, partial [Planctomycetota bacterium]
PMQLDRFLNWLGNTSQRRAILLGVVVCVLASGFVVRSMADEKPVKGNKSASTEKTPAKKPVSTESPKADSEPISPKRETEAVAFAQQHHPQLAELLTRLKASHPEQYSKALRELDKTRSRLEKVREIDVDRYGILLREWQLDSRVRLLAARITMSTSEELETELRQVLTERHDARLQLLTYDREKSKTRLQKMDEQIAEHVQSRETNIDREFDRIKKTAETRKKPVTKPASKRTGDKDK